MRTETGRRDHIRHEPHPFIRIEAIAVLASQGTLPSTTVLTTPRPSFTLHCKVIMHDLHKALGDISTIRREMARSTQFRGYGPATLATTGVFAFVAAGAQAFWVRDPQHHLVAYLCVWMGAAIVSAALTGAQMYTRTRRLHSGLSNEMLRTAVEQFLPSLVAGALLTIVLVHYVPASCWMLPGLWQIIFSIGVFSSCRFLPRPVVAVGAWYLMTGLTCISLGSSRALAPQLMGLAFGVGQWITAAILLVATPGSGDGADNEA